MKKSTTSNGDSYERIQSLTFRSLGDSGSESVDIDNYESTTDNVQLAEDRRVNSDGVLWLSSDSSSCCSIISNFVDLDEYESKYNVQLVDEGMKEDYDGAQWISSEASSCSSFSSEINVIDSDDSCEVSEATACSKDINSSFRAGETDRSQQKDDEIICISDEEVGTSGGILTLDANIKPSKRVEWILQKYTTIRPSPLIRPHVRLKATNLRPIIIDGSNVSFSRGTFSGRKLEICVRAFQNAGHEVVAFMPQFRTMHSATREPEVLDGLEDEGVLVFTPSRSVEGQRVTSYDDRFVVEYADMKGGVIVSRDNFSDLLRENEKWEQTIKRRLEFFWLDDWILFPKYPLGSLEPTLREFLKF